MKGDRSARDAGVLFRSLSGLPGPVTRPALVVVSGLPGTGKSYFTARLAEKVPLAVLESDRLRKLLFSDPDYSPGESARLFRAVHYLIARLLQKKISVVLDATNLAEKARRELHDIGGQTGARVIIVQVKAPPEVVFQRLASRVTAGGLASHSSADWSVYQKLKPTAERIGREHYSVDTSRDISPLLDKIVDEINAH